MDWTAIVTAIGSVGTLFAVWMVYLSVKTDHDWRRRQYAIDLVGQWNASTLAYVSKILEHFPGLREVAAGRPNDISRERAKKIYQSTSKDIEDWALRLSIVNLLNYFEYIAAAYSHKVADTHIIDEHLKSAMMYWYQALKNFVDENKSQMNRDSWEPLGDLIKSWEDSRKVRTPTGFSSWWRGN